MATNNIKKGTKKRRYFTFYGIIAYLEAGETAVEGLYVRYITRPIFPPDAAYLLSFFF